MTKSTQVPCIKCDGKGRLSWTRVANGVCFTCEGRGVLVCDETKLVAARMPRAEVIRSIANLLRQMTDCLKRHGSATQEGHEACLGAVLAHAEEDVHARALAALGRLLDASDCNAPAVLFNIERDRKSELATLASGQRSRFTNVRRVLQ